MQRALLWVVEIGVMLFAERLAPSRFHVMDFSVDLSSGSHTNFRRDPRAHEAALNAFFESLHEVQPSRRMAFPPLILRPTELGGYRRHDGISVGGTKYYFLRGAPYCPIAAPPLARSPLYDFCPRAAPAAAEAKYTCYLSGDDAFRSSGGVGS